ncbi:hypothetical protein LSH36_197g05012 [Paralvinella palmiformis]|uniref:C2H2-type domain-containing protein n=1 Tax=Paralvinella palmiformis TaxID=53620 RepID=A0AAD9JR82_9ANNE|nr:hypothetical protein LSH36_197g05012 [Paralvinella palmiformis]
MEADIRKIELANVDEVFVFAKVCIHNNEFDLEVCVPSEGAAEQHSKRIISHEFTLPNKEDILAMELEDDKSVGDDQNIHSTSELLEVQCNVSQEKTIESNANSKATVASVNGRKTRSHRKFPNNSKKRNTGRRNCGVDAGTDIENKSSKVTNDVWNSKGQSELALVDHKCKTKTKSEAEKATGEVYKFKCEFCKISPFNSEETLNRHIKRHNFSMLPNGEGLYECAECRKKFKSRTNLATHMWIHREKRFSCPQCGKTFVQKVQLKVHISSIHQNEKPYLCSLCGKNYSQQAGLAYHLRVHKSEELKDKVIESEIMSKHGENREGKKVVLCCLICQERFFKVIRWLYHLKKHLQSDAGLEENKRENITRILQENEVFVKSQRVYECKHCDHVSFYSMEHTLHKAMHLDKDPVQCPDCNKTFGQHSNLKYHIRRVHKRLQCQICAHRYGTVRELTEHQVAEHDLDPQLAGSPYYYCKRCQYRSKQKSRLLFHMSQVHNISCVNTSKFSCEWCGKSFATKYSLQLHERTHTNDHPFVCRVCDKSFSDPSNLIHHGARSHPDVSKKTFFSRKC